MKNNAYNPYVTERIRRFDGALTGICYSAPFMHCEQSSHTLLNERNIITLQNHLPTMPELIIIPLQGNMLTQFLQETDNYSFLQSDNVRLAINYDALQQAGPELQSRASDFRFWLYDVASPGTRWQNIENFPLSGIVLTDEFFSENYLKFSFPFMLSSFREREAEVILRSSRLVLPEESYTRLHISGWQEQRTSSNLFEV
ncbi:MAG: hypothetical protein PW844_26255 [Pantoea sp.]|uniref:hypothetical protein n=1 Tax=Pantoea sp. TaxID=69393 RepID=UPI00238CA0CD|nr:hypothetical protein [Pantoea sp.]MDE1189924.1 hypothetical protein [Pantoea sp.]